jgi:hypothetical protein
LWHIQEKVQTERENAFAGMPFVTARISSVQDTEDGKSKVYIISCANPRSTVNWNIRKRYSEFRELYTRVKKESRDLEMPPKLTQVRKLTQFELEQRKSGLNKFLVDVVQLLSSLSPPAYQAIWTFLELHKMQQDGEVNDLEAALLDAPSIPAAAAAAAAAASSALSDWENEVDWMEEVEGSDDYDACKKALDAQATVPLLNNAIKLSTYITLSESLAIEVRLFLLVLRFLPLSLLSICRGEPTLMTIIGGMVTFTTSDAPSSASLLSLHTRTLTQCYLHGSVTV